MSDHIKFTNLLLGYQERVTLDQSWQINFDVVCNDQEENYSAETAEIGNHMFDTLFNAVL